MGLVDGASRNGPDSFWREWWAQTMWPEFLGAGGWASVRGKPPFLCVAFYGQVSHFGGPPAQRRLMRGGRSTVGRWMLGTEISLGSPILSQNVPFAVPVSYGSGRAGRNLGLFWIPVPFCPILSHWLGGGAMDRVFGNAHGVRGLVGPESCRKRANVRNSHRVMLQGEMGVSKEGRWEGTRECLIWVDGRRA